MLSYSAECHSTECHSTVYLSPELILTNNIQMIVLTLNTILLSVILLNEI
jgi:hypothetical protein